MSVYIYKYDYMVHMSIYGEYIYGIIQYRLDSARSALTYIT